MLSSPKARNHHSSVLHPLQRKSRLSKIQSDFAALSHLAENSQTLHDIPNTSSLPWQFREPKEYDHFSNDRPEKPAKKKGKKEKAAEKAAEEPG